MKTKSYKFGNKFFKAYFKSVGEGFEVGLHFNRKSIFVGNFLHKKEAMKWWATMNKEIRMFTTRYWVTMNTNFNWYSKFFSNHLYQTYYMHLDKWFNGYTNNFQKAFKKELKKYNQFKKNWDHKEKTQIRAA